MVAKLHIKLLVNNASCQSSCQSSCKLSHSNLQFPCNLRSAHGIPSKLLIELQESNATCQEGNATCQEGNATCQESNATRQESNATCLMRAHPDANKADNPGFQCAQVQKRDNTEVRACWVESGNARSWGVIRCTGPVATSQPLNISSTYDQSVLDTSPT